MRIFSSIFLLFVIMFSLCTYAGGKDVSEDVVYAASLGQVMNEYDKFAIDQNRKSPFGIAKVFSEFKKQYNDSVRNLSVEYRVRYFTSFLWHTFPQGGYLTEFEEIVLEDCPDEFLAKINIIIETNTRDNDIKRIGLMRGVAQDLKFLLSQKK